MGASPALLVLLAAARVGVRTKRAVEALRASGRAATP
jgi:hypothetical protein